MIKPDQFTKRWIRNQSDELAVANGCKFDPERGSFTVWWIERYCKLYEGSQAGEPLVLRGCGQCQKTYPIAETWEEAKPIYLQREEDFARCVKAKHFLDWQYDCTMRLFSWITYSEKWKEWVRRFRNASIWIAKKNKKSPTLSAWGMYLLMGDGEPGQKVFLGGKDGRQVRENCAKHCIEQLRQSPEILEECIVNETIKQIAHLPSRSVLLPLSSSNSRTQQSKEGLNGSVLIDETHVVDEDFVGRISRAGISRKEPLHIEVSTAGNDPESYGKRRFDYATKVISGEFPDQEQFAAVYAPPQDLEDRKLLRDPLKYARLANPALGHTVDPEELLKDVQRSRGDIREWARCKMYRFNLWQRALSVWLRPGEWDKCARNYTEEDLLGQECYAGLDLGRARDMSALALVFPQEDRTWKCLVWHWMTENYAREKSEEVPFLQWAQAGLLELTPGDDIDFGFIKSRVRELATMFQIHKLYYDPLYANELTQGLEQGVLDSDGNVVEEAIAGLQREIFQQTVIQFAKPVDDLEKAIMAGKFHHNNHKVLNWQMGHVEIWADANKNKRPVKPGKNKDSVKKIDGVVALIMGYAGASKPEVNSIPTITAI